MRTSHIAIHKRIAEKKGKLTDEEFFSSPQYAAYLTDIAEGITKRYHRSSRVKTFYDDSEDAEVAFTDNRVITINAGNFLTRCFPTRKLKHLSLYGMVSHECGHILYSDFDMLALYHSTLSTGRFYPAEPDDLTLPQENALSQIKTAFAKNDKAVLSAISLVTHQLVNIMEDVYIESRMCDAFQGTVRYSILLNNLKFAETMDSVSDEIKKVHFEVAILINLLIQYAKSGDINNLGGYCGPLLEVINDCIPYIDNAAYSDDGRERFVAANHILLLLWPYMQDYIEELKKHPQKAEAAMQKQVASGSSAPNGTGKQARGIGKTSFDPDEQEELRKEIQKVLDEEADRIALAKTDDFETEGTGSTTKDTTYEGSGYLNDATADMGKVLTQVATEMTYDECEKELFEELQAESDKIRYGNAHKGVDVCIHRMPHVGPTYKKRYQQVAPPLLLISKRLQKCVSQKLKVKKEGAKLDNLPMGRRINVRNAFRGDGKIFYKRKLPDDSMDIAIAILNDESGSMSSKQRITYARSASIILYDFCRSLNIPIAVYGHTECYDVDLFAYAEFDSVDGNDKFRMMDMSARDGNRDGAALRFVAERLMTRPEPCKLLFIISDGQPAGSGGYFGTAAEADLRGIKAEYERKGITLFAAAIGDDKPNIKRIYGDGFIDISDLSKLPTTLGKILIAKINLKYAA